jgi:hypothetical protein
MAHVQNTQFPLIELVIDLVRKARQRQLAHTGLVGLGRHQWKIRELRNPPRDFRRRSLGRCRRSLIEITENFFEIGLGPQRVTDLYSL